MTTGEAPQWAQERAKDLLKTAPKDMVLWMVLAHGLAEERERAAAIADAYADENITMAGDTILMDPILSRRPGDGPVTVDEFDRSEDLMIGGTIHSSMFHAAQNIAAAIRDEWRGETASKS